MSPEFYAAMAVQLLVQVVLFAFFYGRLVAEAKAVRERVTRIESFIDSFLRGMIRVDFEPQFPARVRGAVREADPSPDEKKG